MKASQIFLNRLIFPGIAAGVGLESFLFGTIPTRGISEFNVTPVA